MVILNNNYCAWGDEKLCRIILDIQRPSFLKKITVLERLNNLYIIIPIRGWQNTSGSVALEIPTIEIFPQQTLIEKLLFHVIPFLSLIILTMGIYFYTERNLIKPTIKRIIEGEKLQMQKEMIRQFAHDIRSPIFVLEEIVESSPFSSEDANILVNDALQRIKGISNDLLTQEKHLNQISNVKELFEKLVSNKKLEYKKKTLNIELKFNCVNECFEVNPNDLYRTNSKLLNNSIEAVSSGFVSITISVNQTEQGLYIEIADNGEGIPLEMMPLIDLGHFSSKENGHGLGISGAKKWLASLDGSLHIESRLGSGTNINLFIPS